MKRKLLALAVSWVGLAACGPKTVDIAVNVISGVCDPTLDPFMGVNFIQLRVSGEGMDAPIVRQSMKSDGMLQLPLIPAGPKRVVEVRGYADDPGGLAPPISVGRSLPFDVPDIVTTDNGRIEINVFLRKVDSFTPPSSAAYPNDCSIMRSKRAGHAAVLLKDGRVFIVGGFTLDGTAKTALATTEFYDPGTGTFTDAPNLQIAGSPLARAYLTATLLGNGQVLLHGGESYSTTMPQLAQPSSAALIFDLSHNAYGVVRPRSVPPVVARSHHLAVPISSGQVLIVGGVRRSQMSGSTTIVPAPEVEWFDPQSASLFEVNGESFARTEAAGVSVQGGQYVAVAGGIDGNGALTDEVAFWSFDGTTFQRKPNQHLKTARRGAAAAVLSDDTTLLVMGGFADPMNVAPIETSEAVKTAMSTTEYGPNIVARGNLCASLLPQGQVMALGGRSVEEGATQVPRSDGSAVRISFDERTGMLSNAGASTLKKSRWGHTCTPLLDGTVLITGGVNEGAGEQTVLQDAWIYTPIPAD